MRQTEEGEINIWNIGVCAVLYFECLYETTEYICQKETKGEGEAVSLTLNRRASIDLSI